jgi:S-adenosylmethionine hydrolase
MQAGIVALLTDFGTRDAYVGVMKAVVLSRFPALRFVDLGHDLPPHGILPAAYLLYSAWDYFPPGSAFCAVVDPGVGGPRGTLLAEEGGRFLVAPDNGLISLLARMKPDLPVFSLETDAVLRVFPPPAGHPVSSTFHGRDLFAPAAALCAAGEAERIRGQRLAPVLLPEVRPRLESREGRLCLEGWILHIDRFGNCVTSIHRSDLEKLPASPSAGASAEAPPVMDWDTAESAEPWPASFAPTGVLVTAGALSVQGVARSYGDVEMGQPLALFGSAGFLELSLREADAARRFELSVGRAVCVRVPDAGATRGEATDSDWDA